MTICFPDLSVKWNKTDFILELPNGSQILVLGLDDGERTEKILGLELSTVYINEASQVDYNSVQMALTRLAEKNSLRKRVVFDFNPPQKSHWSYYLFIKKLDPIGNVPLPNPEDYVSLLMNPDSNMDNIDPEYIRLLESMPEKEKARFLRGEFTDESNGQVYYAFRPDDHIKPQTKQPGTIFCALDFNVNPFCGVIFQVSGNNISVIDELYIENADTYKVADDLKRRGYGGARIIPDSTAANRKTSGRSDLQILKEAGFTVESTRNPFVMDRVNNLNRKLSAGHILIDPKARKLSNDLMKVVYKDNKPDQSGANKMLTHISDALGYAAWWLDPFNPSTAKVSFDNPRG